MSSRPVLEVGLRKVEPVYPASNANTRAVTLMPNLSVVAGTVMAEILVASQNTVQTLDFAGTVTGGTFTLAIADIDDDSKMHVTAGLARNISNANLKIALEALLSTAGYEGATVTITNGPAPADTTITFGGTLAGKNPPLLVATSSLTGTTGAAAASLTTNMAGENNDMVFTANDTGVAGNLLTIELIDPGAADQALAASMVGNSIKVLLATGAAPGMAITSTAAEVKLAIENVAAADAAITIAHKAGNSGAGVVTALTETALSGGVDGTAIALTVVESQVGLTLNTWGPYDPAETDGRQTARGIAQYSFSTDAFGRVYQSDLANLPEYGGIRRMTTSIWVGGTFLTEELTGLDADAVTDLGRLTQGTVAKGMLAVQA